MSLRVWLPLNGDLRNNGLSNVGIIDSNLTVDNNGKIGKCYSFNGSNSKITNTFNTPVSSSIGSLACWVKFNAFPASGKWYTLLQLGNLGGYATCRLGLYMEYTDKICVSVDGSSQKNLYTHSLTTNRWYHICTTYDGTIIKLYIDGTEVMSTTAIKGTYTTNSSYLFIGATNNFWLNGYMNDARYYDYVLSAKEVKELSKGLICHYPLNQAFPIDNLVRNQTYAVYNNYASSGSTGTLVKTGERYNDCDVYRLTYTPNDTSLANVQSTLYSHGVYGFNKKFLANTKYCFWILWKAISHPDTICGGTASNIGGWTEIPTKKFSGEWNIVGQYRNGTVTTDKTDNIFTSFKTPSATSGTPIIIDFCCPHLVEGYDYILAENDYQLNESNIIYDTSGLNNHAEAVGDLITSSSSVRNSLCTHFINGQYGIVKKYVSTYLPKDAITVSLWMNCSTWGANPISCTEGGGWNFENSSSNLQFQLYVSGVGYKPANSGVTINSLLNNWHMITGTFNSSEVKIYIDGELKKTTETGSTNGIGYASNYLCIGAEAQGTTPASSTFVGDISDVRIYATALSEDDIKELYQVGASIDKGNNLYTYELLESGSNELLAIPYTTSFPQKNDIPDNWYKKINNGEIYFDDPTSGTSAGSRYIQINPTNKTYYYDFCISVSAGNLFYIGFERYDKDKTPRSNNATVYIFGSKPSSDLVKARYKGTVNLSTDGVNPCAFIALRILNRWSGSTEGTEGKATIHYLSLREVDNTTGFETTQLFKTGVFKADDFLEKNDKSDIEKTGIINMPNEFIEI